MAYCPPTLGDVRQQQRGVAAARTAPAIVRQPVPGRPTAVPSRQPVTRAQQKGVAIQERQRTLHAVASRAAASKATAGQAAQRRAVATAAQAVAARTQTPHRQPTTPGRQEVERAQAILRSPAILTATGAKQRKAARDVLVRARTTGTPVVARTTTSEIVRDAAMVGPVTPAVLRAAEAQSARMDTGMTMAPSVVAASAPTPDEAAQAAALGTGQPDATVAAQEGAGGGGVLDFLKSPVGLAVAGLAAFTLMKKGR